MKALICGVGGQDGAYLASLLLSKGYEVFGSSRDALISNFPNLRTLNILADVNTLSMDIVDFRSVLRVVQDVRPDEIYNLSGQTSVGLSFDQPVEAMDSIGRGALNILEVIRFLDADIRFYNASSSECFGDTSDQPATEKTPFRPRSPYAVAKSTAHFLVENYREAYGLFACSGILFNHESPLRPERFVTQKIVSAAARIHAGIDQELHLGNLSICRDWGWAPDYVDAMWRMLQQNKPEDFVVATGNTISLAQFVEKSFSYFDLDWQSHVKVSEALLRPSDITISSGSPRKALEILGWSASKEAEGVIEMMCSAASDAIGAK